MVARGETGLWHIVADGRGKFMADHQHSKVGIRGVNGGMESLIFRLCRFSIL